MKRIALVAIATIGLLCTTADTFGMFSLPYSRNSRIIDF
jgi:hypothetical protein